MAFVKKTWKDRIVQYANRRLLTKSGGEVEQVTVTRDEGTIYEAGDQFNASNMNDLEQRISDVFDYDNTASGSLVHIEDGADNIPVKSLVSQIVAVESGNGQPKSPTNPYSISGFDNGVVTVTSENVFDMDSWLTSINENHTVSGNVITLTYITLKPFNNPCVISNTDKPFFLSVNEIGGTATGVKLQLVDSSNNVVAQVTNTSRTASGIGCKLRIDYGNGGSVIFNNPIVSEHGNTYTFTFGQTVYGGHFDNKGNLVVTHGYDYLSTSDNWNYSSAWSKPNTNVFYTTEMYPEIKFPDFDYQSFSACSYLGVGSRNDVYNDDSDLLGLSGNVNNGQLTVRIDKTICPDLASFVQWITDNQVYYVYELANPITLAITSQDIPTLLGVNNIFSNTGDVEVNYYTDNAGDILNFIHGELSSKADKTEDTTITMASGYTLISSSCGKTDRLVHLNFNVEKTGGFPTGWQVIGTTDFKPNTLVYCPLWNVTNGSANGEVRIDTDGTINFYVVTAGELRLNANIGYITS